MFIWCQAPSLAYYAVFVYTVATCSFNPPGFLGTIPLVNVSGLDLIGASLNEPYTSVTSLIQLNPSVFVEAESFQVGQHLNQAGWETRADSAC